MSLPFPSLCDLNALKHDLTGHPNGEVDSVLEFWARGCRFYPPQVAAFSEFVLCPNRWWIVAHFGITTHLFIAVKADNRHQSKDNCKCFKLIARCGNMPLDV